MAGSVASKEQSKVNTNFDDWGDIPIRELQVDNRPRSKEPTSENVHKSDQKMSDLTYSILVNIDKSLKDLVEVFNSMKDEMKSSSSESSESSDSSDDSTDSSDSESEEKKENQLEKTTENPKEDFNSGPDQTPEILTLVKTKYNFEGREEEDLSFKTGEILEIIDREEGDWWLAKRPKESQKGYIPSNFVEVLNEMDSEENLHTYPPTACRNTSGPAYILWYHGNVSNGVAELMLKFKMNDIGTFLVRKPSNSDCSFDLLILSKEKDSNGHRIIEQYQIKTQQPTKYFISANRCFKSLAQLVKSYSDNSEGLCCDLYEPCPIQLTMISTPDNRRSKLTNIPFSELTLTSILSGGQLSEIWKGKHLGNKDVEIKKFDEENVNVKNFLENAVSTSILQHERFVPVLGISSENDAHYIISDLLTGSLSEFLRTSQEQPIINLLGIAKQIAEGMSYLKTQACVHMNLNAENIRMFDDNNIKIGGFEFVRKVLDEKNPFYILPTGMKLRKKWSAPEAIRSAIFTLKSDVWSYGIILVELTTQGRKPYPGKTNEEAREWVDKGRRHPQPQSCPDDLYNLMLDCWKVELQERPSFSDILTRLEDMIEKMSSE